MVTDSVTVKRFAKPEDAPKYNENWNMVRIENALIVDKGTVSGKPTVDLQMVDAYGNKHLVMTTAGIVSMLHSAIENGEGPKDQRIAALEKALGDAVSCFQNGEDQTTCVTSERVECWESALKGGA